MSSRRFYTVGEVAERWEVSQALVRRLYTHGELQVLRLGRSVRIPESEVERIEESIKFLRPGGWR